MNRKSVVITLALLLSVLGGAVGATAGQHAQAPKDEQANQSQQLKQGNQTNQQVEVSPLSPLVPVGSSFTYQGRLVVSGTPASGNYDFTFSLFNAATGGTQIGSTITVLSQTLSIGTFSVPLDFGSSAFEGEARWLQIGVRPSGQGSYTILSPRQHLTPAPYAIGLSPGATISGTLVSSMFSAHNNQGSGVSGTGFPGVFGRSTMTNGKGVWGVANTGNDAIGVHGQSTNGEGVRAEGDIGVRAVGETGVVALGNGRGVHAEGVFYGVEGLGLGYDSPSRNGVGGKFYTFSTNGKGVEGFTRGDGTSAVGVWGSSRSNIGVFGYTSASTGAGAGIYGDVDGSNPNNWAGYFAGNVNVTGTCCAPGLSYSKIDHPLDPANKYLHHSAVESPDMKTVYDGNVTTDAKGEAVVQLPAYFEALNHDFRYQLTVIGQFAQAIVSSEIKDNRFTIKTDKPNVKVSWLVTGIRKDPFAEAHRPQVEVDKTEQERGKYRHPEEWRQPESKGVDYERTQKLREHSAQPPERPKP